MRASGVLTGMAILGVLAAALGGCDQLKRGGDTDMRWARAALARNPALSVVAEDDQAKVFTVRMTGSGEVRALPLSELVAGPQDRPAAVADAAPTEHSESPRAQPSSPSEVATPSETPAAPEAATPSEAAASSEAPSRPPAGSRVLASGPGYSITAAGPPPRTARASAARPPAPSAQPRYRTAAEKRSDPIICQGNRRLRIDDQNLEFSGDAITAERGCDLLITNSRIQASGIAISARAANVHVENSTIEGADSIDASDGSQVYVQASSFKGLSRRLDSAQLHDLGGNVWN